jgi:hypothetical protein
VKYTDLVLKGVENGDWSGLRNEVVDVGSRMIVDVGLKYAANLIPGVGTVLMLSDGVQLVGKGVASGLEFLGMKEQAKGIRDVLEVIDVKEQAVKATKWVLNKAIDGAGYAVTHPHEVMKQTTDFMDHTSNQIQKAAGNLYSGATSWWNNRTASVGGGGGGGVSGW